MQNAEMINETPNFIPTTEPSKPSEQFTESNVDLIGIIEKAVESGVKKALVRRHKKPDYDFVPCGGKTPGVDTVTLSPEEWKYFVEELETKDPFMAFNNAKYIVKIKRSFDETKATLQNMSITATEEFDIDA